jgi:GNAT superfamily N-acetyltransferase
VTDPAHVRRGIGRALLTYTFEMSAQQGVRAFDCMATRTSVPFYRALGFVEVEPVELTLAPGIAFPAVRMVRGR